MIRVERKADRKPFAIALDPSSAVPRKRSLTVAGHRTSITLEDAFWRALGLAAMELGVSVSALVSAIDDSRQPAGLSAAIRVFLLLRDHRAKHDVATANPAGSR